MSRFRRFESSKVLRRETHYVCGQAKVEVLILCFSSPLGKSALHIRETAVAAAVSFPPCAIQSIIPNDFERARNHPTSVIPECLYRESTSFAFNPPLGKGGSGRIYTPRVPESGVAEVAPLLSYAREALCIIRLATSKNTLCASAPTCQNHRDLPAPACRSSARSHPLHAGTQ